MIVNRDVFSAGGKRTVSLSDLRIKPKLPGVVSNCADKLACDAKVSLQDLSSIGGTLFTSPSQVVRRFESALRKGKLLDHLFEHLTATEKSKVNRRAFVNAVTDYLVEQIDPSTLL